MLNKYQEQWLLWSHKYYRLIHLYPIPVSWNSKSGRLSTDDSKRKWLSFGIGNLFVFSLWLSCVYTLGTQPLFRRRDFSHLHFCTLTTGFCAFTATLYSAKGIWCLHKSQAYVHAINQYVLLEQRAFKSKLIAFSLNYDRSLESITCKLK